MPRIEFDIAEEALLFCPGCGYDLRASTDGRCNECGLPIDRASLRVSAFPWAHRREIGRVRGYARTVWQVLIGSRALAYETAKPQDRAAARAFARVTGALVAITLLLPFAAAVADGKGLSFLAVPPNDPWGPWLTGWMQDVVVPWTAGATLWPVPPLCLILLGFYFARAAQPIFRARAVPLASRERSAAIALYATAPLAIFPLAALVLWGSAGVMSLIGGRPVGVDMGLMLVIASLAMVAIAIFGTLIRVGQWLARVLHGGVLTGIAGAAGLLALWSAGAFVLLGVLPWACGFLWLVVDSLR